MIETFGTITKEEKLQSLQSHILENTFVLESTAPFPGYHGENLPEPQKPGYIFLVTRVRYNLEKIIRTAKEIRNYFQPPFGARPAELHMYNMVYPVIRLNHLEEYKHIAELQQWFEDLGIGFMKKKKFNKPALIMVTKHFGLEQIEEGVFKDINDPLMHYLEIPVALSWKVFEAITNKIKNNLENNNFDAALGVLYIRDIMDMIRIYENNPGIGKLVSLRKMYLDKIRKTRS
ncbi:MAG: hypothetical protein J7K46_09205 [Bacteroidales bacterium]|nr:hypothetical protein [Bacteroidales bacterium]